MKVQGGSSLRKLYDSFRQVKERSTLQVGVFDTSIYPGGVPVAYVAAIHEFGYPGGNIPARPFMRPTMTNNKAQWTQDFAGGFRSVLRGNVTAADVFDQMGGLVAGQIKESIQAVNSPPLDEDTVKARLRRLTKGYARDAEASIGKPLVATGTLLNSIDYKVTMR